jgi:hypothetical protein
VATALVWTPTGSEFGPGFGDFENHTSPATRLGVHFTRSDENKQSQPNTETFDNTQIRLSDGTVVFTPDIFGPGVLVEDVRVRMTSIDAGVKYRGYSLDGEYYFRWLDNFRGIATEGVPPLFDHGFQLQGTAMVVPKLLQLYLGASKISGEHGNPWDARAGVNWFPWKNKVVRWNAEALYLMNSPSGTTSLPYSVGSRGFVFHTTLELAF